jgi:hypothetical protein
MPFEILDYINYIKRQKETNENTSNQLIGGDSFDQIVCNRGRSHLRVLFYLTVYTMSYYLKFIINQHFYYLTSYTLLNETK